MKVYDNEKDDFTPEYQLQLAAMCQMALACELIGYQIADALDFADLHGSFVQERRRALHDAADATRTIIRSYEYMFDDAFTRVFTNRGAEGYDLLQRYSNDIAQVVMLYISRADANDKSALNMKKALRNFKQQPEYGDVEEVLRMYGYNTDKFASEPQKVAPHTDIVAMQTENAALRTQLAAMKRRVAYIDDAVDVVRQLADVRKLQRLAVTRQDDFARFQAAAAEQKLDKAVTTFLINVKTSIQ